MIKIVRYLIDHLIALAPYKSLVLSHLDYCDTIYMTSNQEDLYKLQLAQNVACRTLLLADKYEHIDMMHQELKLEKLETRRKFHLGSLCHQNVYCDKNKMGLQHPFIKAGFGNRIITHNVSCNVQVPLVKSSVGHKAIGYRGPTFWNGLNRNLKAIEKYATFTKEWGKVCCTDFENHPT